MKKLTIGFCLLIFMTGFAAAQLSRNGTMYVAVNRVTLKSSTGFFAGNRGTLDYGARVTVLQISGKYAEIRSAANQALSGWVPSANLTARQIVQGTTATTAREVSLAARGFNQEVEQSYRNQNSNLNYADVDAVEAISISENDLRRFLEDGRLAMGE